MQNKCSLVPAVQHVIGQIPNDFIEQDIVSYLKPPLATSRPPKSQNGTIDQNALFTGKFSRPDLMRLLRQKRELWGLVTFADWH